jgi:hypothetical protein
MRQVLRLQLREIDGRFSAPVGDIDKIGRRLKYQLRRCGLVHGKAFAPRDSPAPCLHDDRTLTMSVLMNSITSASSEGAWAELLLFIWTKK